MDYDVMTIEEAAKRGLLVEVRCSLCEGEGRCNQKCEENEDEDDTVH